MALNLTDEAGSGGLNLQHLMDLIRGVRGGMQPHQLSELHFQPHQGGQATGFGEQRTSSPFVPHQAPLPVQGPIGIPLPHNPSGTINPPISMGFGHAPAPVAPQPAPNGGPVFHPPLPQPAPTSPYAVGLGGNNPYARGIAGAQAARQALLGYA